MRGIERPVQSIDEYSQMVRDDHPVGYWRLGEHSWANHVADEMCPDRIGMFVGSPRLGEAGAIRGSSNTSMLVSPDNFISIPSCPDFSIQTSGEGLTVEVWMRPGQLSFPGEEGRSGEGSKKYIHWLGKGEAGEMEWGLRLYSNCHPTRPRRVSAYAWNPQGGLGAGAYYQDLRKQGHWQSPQIEEGKWVHLVACYDHCASPCNPALGVSLYINGVLAQKPPQPATRYFNEGHWSVCPRSGNAPLRIGTRSATKDSFLTGGLDEVAIYPRVLGAARIKAHYDCGSQG